MWGGLVWMLKITDCITMEWWEREKLTAMMVDVSFIILPFQSQFILCLNVMTMTTIFILRMCIFLIPFNDTSTLCIFTQTHTLISRYIASNLLECDELLFSHLNRPLECIQWNEMGWMDEWGESYNKNDGSSIKHDYIFL